MTIHHDKLAYGKLKPNMEELSEDKLFEMLSLLNEGEEEEQEPSDKDAAKNSEKNQKKL